MVGFPANIQVHPQTDGKKLTMRAVFLTLFYFVIWSASAQYTFEGVVLDPFNEGEPMIGASVRIQGEEVGTVSDMNGKFYLSYHEREITVVVSALCVPQEYVLNHGEFATVYACGKPNEIESVYVFSKIPFDYSIVGSDELAESNVGQDFPFLLDQLPSVTTTSDAGAGVGYTGIRIRGSDPSRINVTINGVPLNDSESQGVFWVDLPDFASSVENLAVQRGVGTSTNGAGAFGGSINVKTNDDSPKPFATYSSSIGSFNTFKNSIQLGSGTLKEKWNFEGRLSKITSNGYIDRASSDLSSYFLSGGFKDDETSVKFITFSGHEETFQAWNGVEESLLETNRTYNVYDYENQVDDYRQDHYQLHFAQGVGDVRLNAGLHYTKGQGFFEEFKEDEALTEYQITPSNPANTNSDLVRRRWLDNDFYGIVFSGQVFKARHEFIAGGAWNKYLGDHFGEVISGEYVPHVFIGKNYYFNEGDKSDFNLYGKWTYETGAGFTPFVDLQFRNVNYDFLGKTLDGNNNVVNLPQSVSHNFFNPKLGVTYERFGHLAYASFAVGNKEPNRSDYVDSPADKLPKAERMHDFELGYRNNFGRLSVSANGYYMNYKDQLAITGGVNDVGEYTRQNVTDSYRAGIELGTGYHFGKFDITSNASFSKNKAKSFVEQLDNFDTGTPTLIQHRNTDLALSPNTIVNGKLEYHATKDLSASWISKFVGKQFLDNTSTTERAIDSYFVNSVGFNATLGSKWKWIKGIDINARINNILNEKYESNGYTFGYIYGGDAIYEEYYYPQAGTHFLAGLNVRF